MLKRATRWDHGWTVRPPRPTQGTSVDHLATVANAGSGDGPPLRTGSRNELGAPVTAVQQARHWRVGYNEFLDRRLHVSRSFLFLPTRPTRTSTGRSPTHHRSSSGTAGRVRTPADLAALLRATLAVRHSPGTRHQPDAGLTAAVATAAFVRSIVGAPNDLAAEPP